MRSQIKEASQTAIMVYLVLILLILPLYIKDGYVMIGDVKYRFFHNITIFFMIVLTVLFIMFIVAKKEENKNKFSFSETDAATVCFLVSTVVSYLVSSDKYTAWNGFSGWHMGLLTQLMFVWIYFAVSRLYSYSSGVLWAFWAGAVVVMVLGVLNCYHFDPLAMFQGLDDWNRKHLLSTIGNKNWYCGYISVASAVCIYFGYHENKWFKIAGLAGCLFFFGTILTQGSEGGYLIVLAEMIILLVWSLDNRKKLISFFSVAICGPLAGLLGQYGIRFREILLVEDGDLSGFLFWKGWLPLLVLFALLVILLYLREKKGCRDILQEKKVRAFAAGLVGAVITTAIIIFVLCQISDMIWEKLGKRELLRMSDTWGNNRGEIWRMAWGSFCQGDVINKLFGVGPDCFYYAVEKYDSVNAVIHAAGQWENAVYANAHNEWLNMLVNQGIFGLTAYSGIFVTQFVRLWRHGEKNAVALLGITAISGYCVYGTVSFQQVVSTPLMFVVLGISEAAMRRENLLKQNLLIDQPAAEIEELNPKPKQQSEEKSNCLLESQDEMW